METEEILKMILADNVRFRMILPFMMPSMNGSVLFTVLLRHFLRRMARMLPCRSCDGIYGHSENVFRNIAAIIRGSFITCSVSF